jgi:deoxyribodipyrimidine photo-lyase
VVPPHGSVSRLSAHLRHRLILERELVAAVIDAHGPGPVHTLVTEVLWRTYWKGWLEQRPQIWEHWLGRLGPDLDRLGADALGRYQAAITGRTGIACFDAWAQELTATGYLHNHVRMWLASIWIFTLGLPWTLGAAFFLRHLLDGDPASNTCSWRWVAGLHTQGKHYLARAENIARWTDGRFDPVGQLNESAGPLVETGLDLCARPIRPPAGPDPERPSGLLQTPEDLAPELSGLAGMPIRGIAGGPAPAQDPWLDQTPMVHTFVDSALSEALTRAGGALQAPVQLLGGDDWRAAAEDWALGLGIRQVLTLDAPIGPWRDRLDRLERRLADREIRLARVRRPWDQTLWPLARRGYFPFREKALAATGPTPLLRNLLTPEQGPPR